jgi:tRNA G10  N-methylase Trm11
MTTTVGTLTATASANSARNKVRHEDRAVHDWYRFVLSFPPHLVQTYVDRFGLDTSNTVLDPFCGTGTTLVECKKLGIASVGCTRPTRTIGQWPSTP